MTATRALGRPVAVDTACAFVDPSKLGMAARLPADSAHWHASSIGSRHGLAESRRVNRRSQPQKGDRSSDPSRSILHLQPRARPDAAGAHLEKSKGPVAAGPGRHTAALLTGDSKRGHGGGPVFVWSAIYGARTVGPGRSRGSPRALRAGA